MKKMVELCCIFALAVLWLAKDASGTEYVYKQMTPKLDQPWYFNSAASIAADSNDRIYIADSFEHQVKKFTSSGVFITQWGWGTPGTGTGEFNKLEDIAVDPSDNVYLVDQDNYRIQKFSKDGQFLKEWGKKGDGPGQFNFPARIAIDPDGYVYVTDSQNGNVQKFTSDGDFVAKWGDQGPAGEQLDGPTGIAADSSGHIYVADNGNQCVKKYTGDGNLLLQWDFYSAFYNPVSLAVDAADQVYLIEYNKYGANGQIKIFTPDGELVSEWGDQQYVWPVPDTGHFYSASGMCVDSKGNIYVPDFSYKSVLKYKADRSFIEKWDSRGRGPGEFSSPNDMAMDAQGYVYIADSLNDRVQKFTPDMTFVTQWGSYGQQDGEFHNPSGLAIDPSGNVYVLEWGNNRIQKFGPDGTLVKNWGEQSLFEYSSGIAVDQAGYVYVADSPGRKVIKYTADGFHVAQWDVEGTWSDPLQPFNNTCLAGIAVDSKGHVYVGDVMDNKVHKFAPDGSVISKWDLAGAADGGGGPASLYVDAQDFVFVSDGAYIHKFSPDGELTDTWGGHGSVPGKFGHISGMALNGDGDLYVTDETLSRVQVLRPKSQVEPGQSKVIIVAGGGNHKDNNLWDATQFCTNYAYRALTFQGYTKETIYYLSPSLGLNLGPEGSLPDVDEDATKGNLEKAITSWADDAGELVLYMVDHGGPENFLMRKGELLLAPELSAWLDQHQAKTNAKVTIVYDACDAGSFIEALSSPVHDRVFIASTADGEDAHFVSTGQISFSYFFWGGIFNGMSVYDAFIHSDDAVTTTFSHQKPLLNADDNFVGNQGDDMAFVKNRYIGNGLMTGDDIPTIGSVNATDLQDGGTQAFIRAENVVDASGISKVWAVISPPNHVPAGPDQPVTDLPEVKLEKVAGNTYQGTYSGFQEKGSYVVAVFASDTNGMISLPMTTVVEQTAGPGYATLSPTLEMTLPCIDILGGHHQAVLEYYPDGLDTWTLFWKTATSGSSTANGYTADCAAISTDIKLTIPKIGYNGVFFQVVLKPYFNPLDPFNLYWMLDSADLL